MAGVKAATGANVVSINSVGGCGRRRMLASDGRRRLATTTTVGYTVRIYCVALMSTAVDRTTALTGGKHGPKHCSCDGSQNEQRQHICCCPGQRHQQCRFCDRKALSDGRKNDRSFHHDQDLLLCQSKSRTVYGLYRGSDRQHYDHDHSRQLGKGSRHKGHHNRRSQLRSTDIDAIGHSTSRDRYRIPCLPWYAYCSCSSTGVCTDNTTFQSMHD